MRDELIEIFNRMAIGLLKKLLTHEGQLRKQENEWQATVDKLIEAQQDSAQERDRLEERIQTISQDFNNLKSHNYNLQNQNQETVQQLDEEKEKNVDTLHLKNIMASYFSTSNENEQQTLMRVVF